VIRTDKELIRAESKICQLKGQIDLLQKRYASTKEALFAQAEIAKLERRIKELSKMRAQYLALLQHNSALPFPTNIDAIAEYLIKRRIMLGISQEKLAGILAVNEKTIRNYEKTRFAGASLQRVQQIDCALTKLENSEEYLAFKQAVLDACSSKPAV
jgi:hypothetical protein